MVRIAQIFLLFFPCLLAAQVGSEPVQYLKQSYHEIKQLGKKVNTERSEVAPHRYAKRLYFSRLPDGTEPGRAFTTLDGNQAMPFEISPNDPSQHLGFTALTNTGQRLYYTLYRQDEKANIYKSQIWYHDREFSGGWGPAKQLPRSFVDNGKNVKHPAPGIFLAPRTEVLFFISDHKDGKGKGDIWCSFLEKDGSFAPPLQFPYNTEEEEASPFFDIANQDLYFSSRGHQSYGGLDVFRSHYLGQGKWTVPENLGRPINSYHDDLFFSFNENGHHCYLSSNRPGEDCPPGDPNCRNFNVFQVSLQATLQVFLFDEYDKSPLYGCNVELQDIASGEILSTYLDLTENFATVGLQPGKSYQLIISKMDYMPVFEEISADEMDFFKTSLLEIRLKPLKRPAVQVSRTDTPNENLTAVKNAAPSADTFEEKPVSPPQEMPVSEERKTVAETSHTPPLDVETDRQTAPSVPAGLQPVRSDPTPEPLSQVVLEKTVAKEAPVVDNQPVEPDEVEVEPVKTKPIREKAPPAEASEPVITAVETAVHFMASALNSGAVSEPVTTSQPPAGKQEDTPVETKTEVKKTEKVEPVATTELPGEKQENKPVETIARAKQTERVEPVTTTEPPTEKETLSPYLQQVIHLFLTLDRGQFLRVPNMPQIRLTADEDPVDLLFFHKTLQCQIAFDFKQKDYWPFGNETMARYLSAIDGLLKKDQHPPIGITIFKGENGHSVVYSFKNSQSEPGPATFVHRFDFPDNFRGVLPDPSVLLGLME